MHILSAVLIGIYFLLSLYHFFIWTGQKNDKLNISLIKLGLVLMSYHILTVIFQGSQFQVYFLIYINAAFCIMFPHIAWVLRLYPNKFRWLYLLGTTIVLLSGVSAISLSIILGERWVFSFGFFRIALFYAILANLLIFTTYLGIRTTISKESHRHYGVYLLLSSSLILSGFIAGFPGLKNYYILSTVLFNGPFLVIMFAYGFMLLGRLNTQKTAIGVQLQNDSSFAEDYQETETIIGQSDVFDSLSNRQRMIISLLRQGKIRKEICDEMNISMNTLKTHITRMFRRFKVNNRVELLNAIQDDQPQLQESREELPD